MLSVIKVCLYTLSQVTHLEVVVLIEVHQEKTTAYYGRSVRT